MQKFTLKQVADVIGGKVEGNSDATIYTLCKIEEGHEGGLSFLANPKYLPYIYKTKATAVIVNSDFVAEHPISAILIRVDDPYCAFAKLLAFYDNMTKPAAVISDKSDIASSAVVGKNVYIGAFAVIGEGVKIGDNCYIYPNTVIGNNCCIGEGTTIYAGVKVYSGCIIGKNCLIHAGAVIGADGFGFAPNNGIYNKIPQIGNVIIQDHVEIGANTCVDKATMGSTIVEEGVKLDNLIQIAHNVTVGQNTVMASQVGVSGSTKIGKNCMFGGQVGLAGHIQIADGTRFAAQSGVPNSVRKENTTLIGAPAIDPAIFMRSSVHFKNFDQIVKRIEELEKKVAKF
ncbi:MAG: UDP-3-O-(3-hydroxymyristoyl)glucosamine N-acyltransferase [Bacteroidales bacterium]|jgi:UDP-3-O-[3-hydroxymyristoyl] glucosamine N-acyltransferase|nr:UDP-3-O-(3-hydroxymyristoyl)glucosamine N-acyltransferase [Bacteroidales bacterium]